MSSSKNENAVMLLRPRAVFIIQSRTRVYFDVHCLHATRCGWSCSLAALAIANMGKGSDKTRRSHSISDIRNESSTD